MPRFPPLALRRARRVRFPAFVLLGALAVVGTPLPPRAVAEPDAALTARIHAAIDRGAKWLKSRRGSDGLFGAIEVKNLEGYELGLSCLSGLALLASGESRKDPGMAKTLDAALTLDATAGVTMSRRTYDTSLLLMFLTEMYRAESKPDKDAARYAKPKSKDPCGLPKDAAERVQTLATWLVSVQLSEGWWRYPLHPPGDLSNTQYALLGLRAARECGAVVPVGCFLRAMDETLARQESDGPKVKRFVEASGRPGEFDYADASGDRARGWKYQADAGGVTGSMTTAAISVLAICRDALQKPSRAGAFDGEHDRRSSRSVQDGFAWLDANFAVDANPPGFDGWHYYYLYGLERACAFAGRERIGRHDWYVEGASHLLDHQKPDGRWASGITGSPDIGPSDVVDTAFALLFLRRASRPTVPIPAPVITSGN